MGFAGRYGVTVDDISAAIDSATKELLTRDDLRRRIAISASPLYWMTKLEGDESRSLVIAAPNALTKIDEESRATLGMNTNSSNYPVVAIIKAPPHRRDAGTACAPRHDVFSDQLTKIREHANLTLVIFAKRWDRFQHQRARCRRLRS